MAQQQRDCRQIRLARSVYWLAGGGMNTAAGQKKIPDRNPIGEEFTETNIWKYSLGKMLARDSLQLTYIFEYFWLFQ